MNLAPELDIAFRQLIAQSIIWTWAVLVAGFVFGYSQGLKHVHRLDTFRNGKARADRVGRAHSAEEETNQGPYTD